MRTALKSSLVVAGALLMLAGGSARANAAEVMRATVPFPFVVRNVTFPAGKYVVRRDDVDPSIMLIQNANAARTHAFVLTSNAGGHDPAGDKPCLTFSRTETNQYRLSGVWESSAEGRVLPGKE